MELAKVNTAAIPPRYIRRPHQEQPTIIPSCEIPVVDLQRLLDQESMDPELPKLHLACKDGGSVQVEIKVNLDSSKAGYLDSKHAAGIALMAQSAGDTAETRELNGVMEMETQTTTHSNPSLENAESSRKTKTAEWTVTITNLLLEAISASFEQLDYPLPSMVMAFVALLLSILDLIHKARKKRISCDGSSLLPCVEYFGFAGAVWQCSHTTVGYHYSRQNLDNPIKMCLLPFIFALCVLISKVVKSN